MDWSRAKTILITSFLLLNMILGFQLWASRSKPTEIATDASVIVEEMNRVLRSKNVRLAAEVPREVPKLREITAKLDDNFKPGESMKLKTPVSANLLMGKGAMKDSQLRSEIPRLEGYQFDPYASKGGVYVFHQLFGQLPMFEVKLELYDKGGDITTYRQAFVEVESGGELKEQKVIPAYVAIRSLVENYPLEGSVITDVRLGYHGQLYNSQTLFMVPSWRVAIGSGDIYYVQAFNGAVEVPQTDMDHTAGDGPPAISNKRQGSR